MKRTCAQKNTKWADLSGPSGKKVQHGLAGY
jgi:hypothetical protein